MDCSCHLVRMNQTAGRFLFCHRSVPLWEAPGREEYAGASQPGPFLNALTSVLLRFSFQHIPASFPCRRPFLPPHRQRLSWPPVTQKQARLSRQPAVVRTKWRTFIFRCISFKTISIGLRGTLARGPSDF